MSARRPRPVRKPVARRPEWVAPAAVVVGVTVLVAAFLVIRWYVTPLPPKAPSQDTTTRIVSTITSLAPSELDAVGQGAANNLVKPISGAAVLNGPNGKPEIFYYGAEFCPYCAAQRWPLIIALSRFGAFSGLQTTTSSSSDVYPNTPTFTFRSATYSSQYIEFRAVETTDRDRNPLQSPSAAEQQLVNSYDPGGTIPFIDIANRYSVSGAMYSPEVVGGMSWQAVADALQQADSRQARAIIGSANLLTAAICKANEDQPASVCSSATVQDLEKKLG